LGGDVFYHLDPMNVTVTGLPAGATYAIADTNGVVLTNPIGGDTNNYNIWFHLNLYLTNVAQGVYTFSLNAGGNGATTPGLPTNSIPFVLQVAHIWTGSFNVSNNWANASSWQGGAPGAADDVVLGDAGAQTNNSFSSGIAFTNVGVDASTTVASLRFAQSVFVGANSTNSLYHTIRIAPAATLFVTGTNGFSILRDYLDEFTDQNIYQRTMGVNFTGGGMLMVSNANANFGILVGDSVQPTLNMSNLNTFVAYVSRVGLGEYQLYPNYRGLNSAFNVLGGSNNYSATPRRFIANVSLAKTNNFITALYQDPNNYTNEFTRSYGVSYLSNEQLGNGSSTPTYFMLGITNKINADGVCFVRASAATGNSGQFQFGISTTNNIAVFRGTNGGSTRMSVFTIADDGGTNQAQGNIKATVDFSANNGGVDILADRLYVSRDRTLIASNGTPNVQGDLYIGRGIVDVNTAILGYQEHSNKFDWTSAYGAQAYLNYCQGRLYVTNGGTFRVNGTLTLGYTADNNPPGSAQQYNTYGQLNIYSNSTVIVSNLVVDGGLNYYDGNGRRNNISMTYGTLVVSNSVGAVPGLLLDSLSMSASTLVLPNVNPSGTNVNVRSLQTPGTVPSVIKVLSLSGVTSFPAQIPVISYVGSASPFFNAVVTNLGANYVGYVLNNQPNHTVDVFITTNPPNSLVWVGNIDNNWDISTKNWVVAGSGLQTNFNLGDTVTFNDSSTVTNVNIVNSVVPGQTGAGVTISNTAEGYNFSGGTIAGTALVVKQGTNTLEFDATEQGPITVYAGNVSGSGSFGFTTIASNVVLNSSGTINGGLISTGTVFMATSGTTINGPVSLQGGVFANAGTVNTTPGLMTVASGVLLTNTSSGIINIGNVTGTGTWDLPLGSTLANFGTINNWSARLTVEGLLFGTGYIVDPNGGGLVSGNGRLQINPLGVISPGATPTGSIGTMTVSARFDVQNTPTTAPFGLGTVRIEVDFSNPQTNDILQIDRWNNITGIILMTNINPGAGSFAAGQVFTVFQNNNGSTYPNFIDTLGYYPQMWPPVPRPGLQWGLGNFRLYGSVSITNSPMVWDGTSGGNWSTNTPDTSWKVGQSFVNNEGSVFDDSASGSTTVNLTTTVAPAGFVTITVTNIVVGVSTNVVITTNDPAISPGIVVSNATKDYLIAGAGKISGMTGLYKTGPGTLTLMSSNDFTGNVIIDNGTVVVTNLGTFANIASLGVNPSSGSIQNEVIMDGGTLKYVGTTNVNLNNYLVINPNGATVEVSSSTNMLTLAKVVIGAGGLTKTGAGTLLLGQTGDVYPGGTTVSTGTLRLTAAAAGTGGVALNNNTTLQVTNNLTLSNALNVAGTGTAIQSFGNNPGTNIFSGSWSGSGTTTFSVTNMFVFGGSLTGFSGTISFGTSSGVFQFNSRTNDNPCTGSAAATFDLGTGSATLGNLNGAGLTYGLGALSGGANTILAGRTSNNIAMPAGTTYSIGANGNSTVFSGKIADGLDQVSVVKVGAGSLFLNGANTYTGGTTVSNGILGGTGSIAGNLTVAPGGTLSPGASVGTFTVGGNVTLNGAVFMELNRTSPTTNDQLVVAGTLTANSGSTLVVTNIGPNLINGTKFQLFNKAVGGAGFTLVTLPAPGTYTWANNIASDGSITLTGGGISTNTPVITNSFSVVNGTLTLNWPSTNIGWRLMSNSVSLIDTSMWFQVVGAENTNKEIMTVDPSKTNVFFRLQLP
jgi:autotransporter-associated beta strand protein